MGAQRKLPDTSQLNLLPTQAVEPPAGEDTSCPLDRFLRGDPERIFIGSQSLRRYLTEVGKGWVIRFRELLFGQDAAPFLGAYQSTGRKPYHPFVILGLILYGSQQGRCSLRELEDLSKLDVGAWWICGGLQPDHSTIGAFFHLHQELLTEAFYLALTSDLLKRLGISAGVVAGDGTVIEAASSRFSMLKAEAAERMRQEAEEAFGVDSDQAQRGRAAAEAAASRDARRKAKGRRQHQAKVCPDEPEAVEQPTKDGVQRPSYKPSLLADANRLIVGQYVDSSSEMKAVSPMLAQHHHLFGRLPVCSLWDGNYNTFEMLSLAFSLEMDCLCAVETKRRDHRFSKENFSYDPEADVYRCPAGHPLRYRKSGQLEGRSYREYQCSACADCPLREQCTKSKTGRSVIRYEEEPLKEAMREVMAQPAARKRFRYRKALVEPVFGHLAERHGLRRFHRKGLANVRVEFAMHCMAYNLRRAIRLEKGPDGVLFALMAVCFDAQNRPKVFLSAIIEKNRKELAVMIEIGICR